MCAGLTTDDTTPASREARRTSVAAMPRDPVGFVSPIEQAQQVYLDAPSRASTSTTGSHAARPPMFATAHATQQPNNDSISRLNDHRREDT
jgi:hypothetical protein